MSNVIENMKGLRAISKMADASKVGGVITEEEHLKVKGEVRKLELDNLFKAMADFCGQP